MSMFPQIITLDDPPPTEQLRSWGSTRKIGRVLYMLWGLVWGGGIAFGSWFGAQIVIYMFSERGVFHGRFNDDTYGFIAAFSLLGGYLFWRKWQENEKIYSAVTVQEKSKPISTSEPT